MENASESDPPSSDAATTDTGGGDVASDEERHATQDEAAFDFGTEPEDETPAEEPLPERDTEATSPSEASVDTEGGVETSADDFAGDISPAIKQSTSDIRDDVAAVRDADISAAIDETGVRDKESFATAVGSGVVHATAVSERLSATTIETADDVDDSEFFTASSGGDTVVTMYDFEKEVDNSMKPELFEIDRYWVNKPYAFVSLLESEDDNEVKYYAVEPHLTPVEEKFLDYLAGKIRKAVAHGGLRDSATSEGQESIEERRETIREKTYDLLERFELYTVGDDSAIYTLYKQLTAVVPGLSSPNNDEPADTELSISVEPEQTRVENQQDRLSYYQVQKLLYYLQRDFVGYEKVDPIKNDISVEDISCNGYNRRVFAYHTEHEQIISNIKHGKDELDDFVIKLAQRSGKGISKRSPQVDATLPDGSRAQLTLGDEVSDHGTNYTIRQFKDVPFTPVDLINWKTFSLDQMAFLWLAIENHKSLIFAGGTASGKTTSLNAVSLFIPSGAKVVSIEDTREVELPQRNWIASVTRPSFTAGDKGDVDEFDLLEAALRQRPDFIVMGEIRGEEGRTAFQVMSTGHTTYTTFHADSVGEVLKRFTTDPINVSKTMFTALDLVSIQVQTRTSGRKVRRSKTITEINRYDAENDEINIRDIYQWDAERDEFNQMGNAKILEEIAFDRGWSMQRLDTELNKRKIVLAYLIEHGLNTYKQVAATIQAFIASPDAIMSLIATDELKNELEDLQKMESVLIDVSQEDEQMVPRPDPDEEIQTVVSETFRSHRDILTNYSDRTAESLLSVMQAADDPTVDSAAPTEVVPDDITDRTELEKIKEQLSDDVSNPADAGSETPPTIARNTSTPNSTPNEDAGAEADVTADGGVTKQDAPHSGEESSKPDDETKTATEIENPFKSNE